MARRRSTKKHVLISWVATRARAAPLMNVLAEAGSDLRGTIATLYLCHRDAADNTDDERAALAETRAALGRLDESLAPRVVPRPWKTTAQPTDHEPIRAFAEEVLRDARDAHPDATLYVHLSPGTPAMHAVWLLLGTTGFVEGPVELVQTRRAQDRRPDEPVVRRVHVAVDTWAKRVREAPAPLAADIDDDALWDPARVRSRAAREVLDRVERWAPMPAPILLLGERGTGKTTLANTIRARSGFTEGSRGTDWPVVVCGEFRANPELARSALFGHVPGAFTGADEKRARRGLLEEANGDTLFLDEIADLDGTTQRLLIAAVEGRGFRRLGDEETRFSTFRLLAATNRDLDSLRGEVLDEAFLDRIATFTLHLPPLRDRRADLPLLWRSSLNRVKKRLGRRFSVDGLAKSRDVLDALTRHPLPGNLRDLHDAAWHGVAVLARRGRQRDATEAALAALGPQEAPTGATSTSRLGALPELPVEVDAVARDLKLALYEAAMARSRGNISEAARLLGLKRKTFDNRWKQARDV